MVLGNIGDMPQKAAATRPRWNAFLGRLVWVFPKGVKPPANGMGESVICDVAFFDGGPITHITDSESGAMTPLAQPVQPMEVVEDVYVSSTRIVGGLKDAIGKHDGFVVRVAKDGSAVVLRKATPEEEAYGARWVEQHRGQQQRVAAAADPFAAAQQQLAAQQPQQGMPQQYGQQFAVPPPGYGAQAPQQPAPASYSPVQAQQTGNGWQQPQQPAPGQQWATPTGMPPYGQQVEVAGQQFTANGPGAYGAPQPAPVQQPPAPPAPQQSAPPMTPEQWAAQQFGGGFNGPPPF